MRLSWLEQFDSLEDFSQLTLEEQYIHMVKETPSSTPMNYGDMSLGEMALSEFFGGKVTKKPKWEYYFGLLDEIIEAFDSTEHVKVKQENMKLFYLKEKGEMTKDPSAFDEFVNEVKMVARSEVIFNMFKRQFNLPDKE